MITHVDVFGKKVEVLITGEGTQTVVIQTGMRSTRHYNRSNKKST
ncbi:MULTISPECIES: hypothetical protein [unclassified Bacillus (in: firmicutes)]|nr:MULTISPECIES: hypothetical protein [unclassified Bacillus (in: firmicutes)]